MFIEITRNNSSKRIPWERGRDTPPARSIFVHDYLASQGLAQAPAKSVFDGWADSMAAPQELSAGQQP